MQFLTAARAKKKTHDKRCGSDVRKLREYIFFQLTNGREKPRKMHTLILNLFFFLIFRKRKYSFATRSQACLQFVRKLRSQKKIST